MCYQNVTEPQAQNITKSTHCESGLDIQFRGWVVVAELNDEQPLALSWKEK